MAGRNARNRWPESIGTGGRNPAESVAGIRRNPQLRPIPKSHPMTTPPEVVEKLLALSLEHPTWGCDRLSAILKLEGAYVSGPTVCPEDPE